MTKPIWHPLARKKGSFISYRKNPFTNRMEYWDHLHLVWRMSYRHESFMHPNELISFEDTWAEPMEDY